MGHGSWVKWVTIFGWVTCVMGHCQWPIDPWWWNNCVVSCNFLFLVDIKKMPTYSVSPVIIAVGLILIYNFLPSRLKGLSSTTVPRPLLVPCVGVMTMGHGSRKMTHFHLWLYKSCRTCFMFHCMFYFTCDRSLRHCLKIVIDGAAVSCAGRLFHR